MVKHHKILQRFEKGSSVFSVFSPLCPSYPVTFLRFFLQKKLWDVLVLSENSGNCNCNYLSRAARILAMCFFHVLWAAMEINE